jgi:hypothetical protein
MDLKGTDTLFAVKEYLLKKQLPTDRRRVKTPPVVSICGVCTHIAILYVVCELRHGESTTSAAQPHILEQWTLHCVYTLHVIYNEKELLFPSRSHTIWEFIPLPNPFLFFFFLFPYMYQIS